MANGGQQEQSFVARSMNQQQLDIEDIARAVYAEDPKGGPESWMAMTNVMNNRKKSGKYGESWRDVLGKTLSKVTKDSQPYKFSGGGGKDMNQEERNAFGNVKKIVHGVINGQMQDNTKGATYAENIQQYGMPDWAKKMVPTTRVGSHTYFYERPEQPTIREGGGSGQSI